MFENQTVVVTGAGSGIGKAFAEGFMADGASVVAADINPEGLESLAVAGAITTIADVRDDAAVRTMVDRAVADTGRVDVLINNAGIGSRREVSELADGEFENMIAVHLFGCIYGMRAAIPVMRRQRHGRIINVISRAAEMAGAGNSAYSSAKAGMWAASRAAAMEVRDDGILVNMLFPGMTNTAIWGQNMPGMQSPDAVYPTARMLAALPMDGPSGEVFYREAPYRMFDPGNRDRLDADRAEVDARAQDGESA